MGTKDVVELALRKDSLGKGSRFRIPQDLSPAISEHLVPVTKPEDIYKTFQARREYDYRKLISRLVDQILFGCTNPLCSTPTCLSYRRRTTKGPLRQFTRLSARTLACHLASEPNPKAKLCPHRPKLYSERDPEEISAGRWNSRGKKSNSVTFEAEGKKNDDGGGTNEFGPYGENSLAPHHERRPAASVLRPGSSREEAATDHGFSQPTERRGVSSRSTKALDDSPRDPRSLTQSLFATAPLRMLEWLPRSVPYGSAMSSPSSSGMQEIGQRGNRLYVGAGGSKISDKSLFEAGQDVLSKHRPGSSTPISTRPSGSPEDAQELTLGYNTEACVAGSQMQHRHATGKKAAISSKEEKDRLEGTSSPGERVAPRVSTPAKDRSKHESLLESEHNGPGNEAQDRGASANSNNGGYASNPCGTDDKANKRKQQLVYALDSISSKNFERLQKSQVRIHFVIYRAASYPVSLQKRRAKNEIDHVYARWKDFVQQSCFYLLRNPKRLANGFEWNGPLDKKSDAPFYPSSIHPVSGVQIFRSLHALRQPQEILQFLSFSLEEVYLGISDLLRPLRKQLPRDGENRNGIPVDQVGVRSSKSLSDKEAAFTIAVMLYGLCDLTTIKYGCPGPDQMRSAWEKLRKMKASGRIWDIDAFASPGQASRQDVYLVKSLIDIFDQDHALKLVSKVAKAVSSRVVFSKAAKAKDGKAAPDRRSRVRQTVPRLLMRYLVDFANYASWPSQCPPPSISLSSTTLEWLRAIMLQDWDGKPVVRRAGTVGGSLLLLATMHEQRSQLKLDEEAFHTPFLADRLDEVTMPVEWLSYRSNNATTHLLSYPFLFPPSALVTYFRALNLNSMWKACEKALLTAGHLNYITQQNEIPVHDMEQLRESLSPACSKYLVLRVRRDRLLTDAMDQLWRRRKSELMVPLRVEIGSQEGEEGYDSGGVQQEFFRVLLMEALDHDYGMFTIDQKTQMTWFRPGSLEPLYKYELLGMLFSLAVYNSVILPVTFPLAFYRKLLGLPVKELSQIRDGWPELAKGLQELLDWSDGDVGEVFMRTYEFSYDAFGRRVDVDMRAAGDENTGEEAAREKVFLASSTGDESQTAENSCSSPPPIVTNANRHQYVRDYIYHLTTASISAQFNAFQKGFLTCLCPDQLPHNGANITTSPGITNINTIRNSSASLSSSSSAPSSCSATSSSSSSSSSSSTPVNTTLSIFYQSPEVLRSLVEGQNHQHQFIDTHELERITWYGDGYHADHPTIRLFWDIVHDAKEFPESKRRALLEFVTASDRLPIGGVSRIDFGIQRCAVDRDDWYDSSSFGFSDDNDEVGRGERGQRTGGASATATATAAAAEPSSASAPAATSISSEPKPYTPGRLPTSVTCFGRLLLPEYSDRQVLKEKLEKALEHCRGFGVA